MALTYDVTIDLAGGYDREDGEPLTEAEEAAIQAELARELDAIRDAAEDEREARLHETYGFGFTPDELLFDPIPF